ncbi:hypothetical protein [Streptomyces poonensis]|uniref:Uncharacterized protein n=1 Tax=Streptomyces poonensis TaxID=68255 RepID=A0A918Q4H0_9ACTN|nr:hypothetical protein [Streptomyces poonensis]GGZ30814.1 hypothetical protein GCM10010365_59140 [Streptomyces poonensis]GLJ88239.1 hypothetical protein GCM10017589_08390 [Streptomyces poonensis]
MSEPAVTELLGRCGLEVLDEPPAGPLPAPRRAVGITIGGTEPAAKVPLAGPALSARVDAAWLQLARDQHIVDTDGRFLITTTMDGPWIPVRLQGDVRMAEHLVGRGAPSGHAEFVTMARDGSVMCGVTTEEYDVWLVVDRERIKTPPPPPPDIEKFRAATRAKQELEKRYAPERLEQPLDDGWVLLAFHRHTMNLRRLHEIPAESSRDLPPELLGDTRPGTDAPPQRLSESQAQELGRRLGIPVDTRDFGYFLEYQSAEAKSRQSQSRAIAPGLLS